MIGATDFIEPIGFIGSSLAPDSYPDPQPAEFPNLAYVFYRASADNEANTSYTLNEQFDPSDVDTTNHKINLPDLGFGAFAGMSACGGNAVRFSSTGTLPAPLVAGDNYYLSPASGGGYDIYPECTTDHAVTTPGAFEYETPMPAQNYAQRVNKIEFSGQGTGAHTVYTPGILVSSVPNLVPDKAYASEALTLADKNTWFEVFTDGDGRSYFDSRRIVRDNQEDNGYNVYGKTYPQRGAAGGAAARAEVAEKRCSLHTFVCTAELTQTLSFLKCWLSSASINTTTNIITYTAHQLVNGTPVRLREILTGVLPAPLDNATTYYARAASANTITLHPSAADATANTNIIDITDAGSGNFQLYAESMPGESSERMRFLDETFVGSSARNVNTISYNRVNTGDTNFIATDFIISGNNNGDLGAAGRTAQAMGAAQQVYLAAPPGCVLPTRLDTGLPLQSGYYWISLKDTGVVYVRLHDTEASAIAAAGVTTLAASCIKYTGSAGSGRFRLTRVSRRISTGIDRGSEYSPANGWTMPQNQLGVVSCLVDYNDPSASAVRERWYYNGELVADDEVTGTTKGNTAAVVGSLAAWFMFNSAAAHVTWEGRVYEWAMAATTAAVDEADILAMHDYYMNKYEIA